MLYKQYTRLTVINNYAPLAVVLAIFVVIPFGLSLKGGDFKVMK
jgi:hypothetical protein